MTEATIIEDVRAQLVADADYATVVPGQIWVDGIFDAAVAGVVQGPPLSEKRTVAAFEDIGDDRMRLQPCLVLKRETAPLLPTTGLREVVRISAYDYRGYDRTRAALEWAKRVLDPTERGDMFGPLTDGRYYICNWAGQVVASSADDSVRSYDSIGGAVSYEAALVTCESIWPTS